MNKTKKDELADRYYVTERLKLRASPNGTQIDGDVVNGKVQKRAFMAGAIVNVHTSKETQEYLNLVSNRFEFVFTPTHGSWLQYGRRFLQNERSKSKVLAWNVIDRGMGCSRLVFNEGGN